MIYEKIGLMPGRPWVTLEIYLQDVGSLTRDAMLVIPGGGYSCVCADREGGPIALAYYMQGMNCFVLNYSVAEQISSPFDPLEEASAAMMYIKQNAERFKIDPERVFAVGFSAGGHLAAWLGTDWNCAELQARIPEKGEKNRPAGVVLCYPVITAVGGRESSFDRLYGHEHITQSELDRVSIDKRVGEETVPAFIMHTFDDGRVPVENALLLAEAYAKNKIPLEMHVYPHAPHGVALGTDVTSLGNQDYDDARIARWVADSRAWMKQAVR